MQKCITNNTVPQFSRVPFTATVDDEDTHLLNVTLINEIDLMDDAFAAGLMKIQDDCQAICRQKDCDERLYVTQLLSFKHDPSMRFKAYVPLEPETLTEFLPRLPLIEYLIYLSSVLGLWMGWSVMQIADGLFYFAKLLASRAEKRKNSRNMYAKKGNSPLPIYY